MHKIYSGVLSATQKYKLVIDGDRIAVGLSGGKDSLTLLACMALLKKHSGINFELCAILIDQNSGRSDLSNLQVYCDDLGVVLHIVKTDIFDILFKERKEKNPCALCSNLRKGYLVSKARELGCNKIALGHHADDFIETFFLSMFYENRLSTFEPSNYLDRNNITQIRPMIAIREKEILRASIKLPILHNPCPADKHTKREDVKALLIEMEKLAPKLKENVLTALLDETRWQNFFKK